MSVYYYEWKITSDAQASFIWKMENGKNGKWPNDDVTKKGV